MIIKFTDIYGKEKGTVQYEGGRLTASNDNYAGMVSHWLADGKSPEEFVEKFKDWSNGYSFSEVVSE